MSCDAKAYIAALQPYQPGLPIAAVARKYGLDPTHIAKLASNENPRGMSPKARTALEAALGTLHQYPEQHDLTHAVAAHCGVAPEQVVLGNGSNDVLDLIARTFLGAGDEALSSRYAFAIYQIATQSTGAAHIVVPAYEYGHDLAAMQEAITPKTKVIWIANPNNPTGTFLLYGDIQRFLEAVPPTIVVVLDEAYFEYLPPELQADTPQWLSRHPNLIVVRTFSKAYGLAGLRVGYGLATSETAELLNRVRQPFNVSAAAVAAATAALEDTAFVEESRHANQQALAHLKQELDKLSVPSLPAYGNFITIRLEGAAAANEFLLQQGVIVRPLAAYGMPEHLRVTAGMSSENDRFLAALKQWLEKH